VPLLFFGGQKLGREIQPAAAFDGPCSALIVHLAWRTLMARRCGGHRRIRGARAGEPTSMLCPLPQVTRSCWGRKVVQNWYFHCRATWYNDTWACTHMIISSVHCCVPRRQLFPTSPVQTKVWTGAARMAGWLPFQHYGQQC